jgi:hypothetical protein
MDIFRAFWSSLGPFWRKFSAYGAAFLLLRFIYGHLCSFIHQYPPSGLPVATQWFAPAQAVGPLAHPPADEISGLAPAQAWPRALWAINDGGSPAQLFLLGTDGSHRATFHVAGATNRDWEGLAACWLDSAYYLFVGDIGDNDGTHDVKYIYQLPEPRPGPVPPSGRAVTPTRRLRFRYPDGNRDAEALLADPVERALFIISKRERRTHLYRLPLPPPGAPDTLLTAELAARLPFGFVTSADLDPTGQQVLLKDYREVYYWRRRPGQPLAQLLQTTPIALPYQMEPRGEALAFAPDGQGYYTLSEDVPDHPPVLYFYPRLIQK